LFTIFSSHTFLTLYLPSFLTHLSFRERKKNYRVTEQIEPNLMTSKQVPLGGQARPRHAKAELVF